MENLREAAAPSDPTVFRRQVNDLLQRYRNRLDQLRRENSAKRIDLIALEEFQNLKLNNRKQIGVIRGIEIGDRFENRAELVLIGLHQQLVNGIDYTEDLATSIVASGHYADNMSVSNELIYSGEGSNPSFLGDKAPRDQKLESGNLALKNSMDSETPVRVIRQLRDGPKHKNRYFFAYDGLYKVKSFLQKEGVSGKTIFEFSLKRIEGQQPLRRRKLKRVVLIRDISEGKEGRPVTVVNSVDFERLPQFSYISTSISPTTHGQSSSRGCDCKDCCSRSRDCSCEVKNGGNTLYDSRECLVSSIPIIHECGPPCNCSQSCMNRVCQRGTKFRFEIFKTNSGEWGVKTMDYIPKGRFVCEYAGESIQGDEAEQRLKDAKTFLRIGGDEGIIDTTRFANVAKFIRRNNYANLYAKTVYYGCGIPHVVFFSEKSIGADKELSYRE